MDWNTQKIFQIFPFYNTCIGRSKIKKLSNLQLLEERPFYDELSIVKTIKTNSAFSGYGRSYKLKMSMKKILWFSCRFLNQVLSVLSSKIKTNGSIEYSPAYFNSTTKTVINHEFGLDQSFQEILYRIDN